MLVQLVKFEFASIQDKLDYLTSAKQCFCAWLPDSMYDKFLHIVFSCLKYPHFYQVPPIWYFYTERPGNWKTSYSDYRSKETQFLFDLEQRIQIPLSDIKCLLAGGYRVFKINNR